ncbi:MAG TPA: hypothetical protein DHW42_04905 [Candidatus Marinimicrobia bacterium]|nr:hypothetical protein [Candidatus Neomarinimicrobiota bacterium]
MLIINSYVMAVVMCVMTMLCWGSWANTQKLASKEWRFHLFYWDYSIGVLLLALVLAFTLGSVGSAGRGFIEDLRQAGGAMLWSAFLGVIIFNFANILLVAAIDIAGMAVALAERKTLVEAIRFANAAAALSVTKLGAQPSAPKREEIEQMLFSRN